jgi:hypothetical protein
VESSSEPKPSSSQAELEEEFRKSFTSDVYGDEEEKSVEQALQEALDDTTPEEPGRPKKKKRTSPNWGEWL